MNANELADGIKNFYSHPNQPYFLTQIETMLRQQQAEIELLKRNMNTATNELLQQQAEIEALKAKTLTDEEIKALWKPLPDTKYYDSDIFNFARAILRKAQEK